MSCEITASCSLRSVERRFKATVFYSWHRTFSSAHTFTSQFKSLYMLKKFELSHSGLPNLRMPAWMFMSALMVIHRCQLARSSKSGSGATRCAIGFQACPGVAARTSSQGRCFVQFPPVVILEDVFTTLLCSALRPRGTSRSTTMTSGSAARPQSMHRGSR
jgi:hypothetical protein